VRDPEFVAVPAQGSVLAELGDLLPANPFATAGFIESKREAGYAPWVLVPADSRPGARRSLGQED
jgi:hypothetical protein